MPVHRILGAPIVVLSSVGDIFLDMVEEVTVEEETLITKHPTESGVNISDHIVNLPIKINISGRFVDSPLAGFGGESVFFNPAQAAAGALESGLGANRSVEMWHELEKLRDRKERVNVNVQQRNYEGMVVARLSAPRGRGDGGSQRFRIEMEEIITTSSTFSLSEAEVADDVFHTGVDVGDLGQVGTKVQ